MQGLKLLIQSCKSQFTKDQYAFCMQKYIKFVGTDDIFYGNNPKNNHESVHNAVKKASKDSNFISHVVEQLDTLKFPAYKRQILSFIQNKSSDENVIGLLRSLNDTVLFQDKYDVKQGLEQENSESKQQNQISDNTRTKLEVQHQDKTQKRKDYPEVPAPAMENYTCSFCGKDFQSSDQLIKHQEFEFKDKGQE